MIKQDQAQQLLDGGSVVGTDGDSIGKIGQVYLDNESGNVSWVTVKTGFFGSSEAFVPTDQATVSGDTVTAPYDKAKVKGAPHFEVGTELSPADEEELYRYYGIGAGQSGQSAQDVSSEYVAQTPAKTTVATEGTDSTDRTATAAARTSGDGYITRSEEQLHVGTERVETGRARLRKFVVTEQQTVTVPVSHEEVHVVREAIQPGDSVGGATIGEDAVEVTLTAERPVVQKEVVGVERVKLDTDTVTEQQQVSESVRKEQVEVSGDTDAAGTTGSATNATANNGESLGDKAADKGQSLGDKAADKGRALFENENR